MTIVVSWKDGFGQTRQYKDPEHGWTLPSAEAGVKAAKAAIKKGALQSDVWAVKEPLKPGEEVPVAGTHLRCFERGSSGQAIERRV